MTNHRMECMKMTAIPGQGMEKTNDGALPEGGEVIRYHLEAGEVDWEIAPGHKVRGYGLNGQAPGPVLEAKQGVRLEIEFTNGLPEPTVIHWHGLRVPAAMDGTEVVQRLIQPGETFTYRFTPPDAGTFWYHSHANETEQMEKGLYGALVVRAADELTLDAEKILVFDDLRVDKTGQIAKFGGLMDRHNGREGNVRLINGSSEPEIEVAAGQIERWRIVNASSARYIRLSLGGRPFHIIGTDGGLIEAPVTVEEVLLPPADRVELAVGPFENEGDVFGIEDLPYNRMAGKKGAERFGTVRVAPRKPSTAEVPARLRDIAPLVTGLADVTRTVKLGFKMNLRRGFDFVVNGERHHHDQPVKVGELQVWDVVNNTMMDHPFHLHGFFFQVLEVNGKKPAWRSVEDVINVPPKATVRIAWVPDDRPYVDVSLPHRRAPRGRNDGPLRSRKVKQTGRRHEQQNARSRVASSIRHAAANRPTPVHRDHLVPRGWGGE